MNLNGGERMKDKEAIEVVESFLMFVRACTAESTEDNIPAVLNMDLVESMEIVLELAKEYAE